MPQRASDIKEQFTEKAFMGGIGGIIALAIAGVLFAFKGQGALMGLIAVLGIAGIGGVGYAIYNLLESKKVHGVGVHCPYCSRNNLLMATPEKDFTCQHCNRLVPIQNGKPMEVFQVRCGYCNALNYYSGKTEVLLCEDCNREVPISLEEGRVHKHLAKGLARVDDDNVYELRLLSHDGRHTEDLIAALQHMLALNRNQVKQMLEQCPITLLTGIPRMKAEMLSSQLATHGGQVDYTAMS